MATVLRPDVDIEFDLQQIIKDYPPSNNDRHHIYMTVKNGDVTLSGHVKSPMTRRILVSRFKNVPGVRSVNADELYDDETIRLTAGKMVPPGALVTSDYGMLILAGTPEKESAEQMIPKLAQIPGVKRVINTIKEHAE